MPEEKQDNLKNYALIKMGIVVAIILVLLIPSAMISQLVDERQARRDEAITEVSDKWGNNDIVIGPILTLPYRLNTTDSNGKIVGNKIDYIHFLPEELDISGDLKPQTLSRGIYKVTAYNTELQFSGNFSQPDLADLNINKNNVLWNEATISLIIPDMKGVRNDIKLKWDNIEKDFEPGLSSHLNIDSDQRQKDYKYNSGVSVKIPLNAGLSASGKYNYSFNLDLNGSQALNFIPLGSQTNVNITSAWANPSFDGAFLPAERTIDANGFSAQWKVLKINRSFSQAWQEGANNNFFDYKFGVKLIIPVDEYQRNTRSVKYAILTLALTFLIFFFVEVLNKRKIHPMQYTLVGLALLLFYTLLLSLSEHIGFDSAYLASALAIISMITLYSLHIFKSWKLSVVQTLFLVVIYLFIFIIIQSQDYALVMGSIGLFIALAIVMYVSRRIDWYGDNEKIMKVNKN